MNNTFVTAVQQRVVDQIQTFFAHLPDSAELRELADFSVSLSRGGKLLRSQLVRAGAMCGSENPPGDLIVNLAAALELYQISALIHDDLIDEADTRRGEITTHIWAAGKFGETVRSEPALKYGASTAIVLGDIFLSLAQQTAAEATQKLTGAKVALINRVFAEMTAQVALGQYLDIHAAAFPPDDPEECRRTAETVIAHKTETYSALYPLHLGALAANAPENTLQQLNSLGRIWGRAFQLRDDELGVFGDSKLTGKPVGDDLREGKRTVLVALTLQELPCEQKEQFINLLGKPNLSAAEITQIQDQIRAVGAYATHEQIIQDLVQQGDRLTQQMKISAEARAELHRLGAQMTGRRA